MKKIKVFLGGFINYTNAQNLNCLALAKQLDKEKFIIYTLRYYSGTLLNQELKEVKIFNCFKPARLSLYLGFLWGIWHCDVAYLPKDELWRFNRLLLWLFNKKSFKTIEGILDEDNLMSAVNVMGSKAAVMDSKSYCTKTYAITKFLGQYNFSHHQLKVEDQTLYLGCETTDFLSPVLKNGNLKKVVYIGRLKKRKGVFDFLLIAEHFPTLEFYMFGNGEDQLAIESYLNKHELSNVKLMGSVGHIELAEFLEDVDLHILPSRSEGFPKVTLETAAAGIPSILYDNYGANEWIENGVNSWTLKTIDDIITVLAELKEDPLKMQAASIAAVTLAQSFDWKERIKDWEEIITVIHQN